MDKYIYQVVLDVFIHIFYFQPLYQHVFDTGSI